MRAPRNLFSALALAFAFVSVCSAQENQNPIPKDNVLMHKAMIKGDTDTMKLLLDNGSIKLDGWVGIGNIQTWVEDACFSGSPVAIDYLLQRGPTLCVQTRRTQLGPILNRQMLWVGASVVEPGEPAQIQLTFSEFL